MDVGKWMVLSLSVVGMILAFAQTGWAGQRVILDGYQWKNRLVLVFAPSVSDVHYDVQMRMMADKAKDFIERDLLWYCFALGRQVGATPLSLEQVAHIKKVLKISDDEFALILIGKDGGVKLRSAQPVSMAELFGLIDGMPMRRQEMREQKDVGR